MATMQLDFVSQDHMVFTSDQVSAVMAPGVEGVLTVLPRHAPLMTILSPGEVVVKLPGQPELFFAVSGGWMEVRPDKTTILARTAERSDEIDLKRAEEARLRAENLLAAGLPAEERASLEMALRRSQIRVNVARKRARRGGPSGDIPLDER
jgi:F-type H+-transporting ATPase subunit epsilon